MDVCVRVFVLKPGLKSDRVNSCRKKPGSEGCATGLGRSTSRSWGGGLAGTFLPGTHIPTSPPGGGRSSTLDGGGWRRGT